VAEFLKSEETSFRVRAARTLGAMGPHGRRAADAVAATLSDAEAEVRVAAFKALVEMETVPAKAAPAFLAVLDEVVGWNWLSQDRRSPLGWVGGAMRKVGPRLAPALVKLASHEDAAVRARAAGALGLCENPKYAVPALVKALGDDADEVRLAALRALGEIGPHAREGILAVAELLASDDADTRRAAAEAVEKIRGRAR
jgi:HEAT repeat protein